MSEQFINLTIENIDKEHLCCAIANKKHQAGVAVKKNWLKERIAEGHVSENLMKRERFLLNMLHWKLRGCLFMEITICISIVFGWQVLSKGKGMQNL